MINKNKIYIIGTGRSGKSFLAGQISKKTKIQHYDLDNLVFIEVGKTERDAKSRDEAINNILLSDSWIIEGVYTEEFIKTALDKADVIIWVDTPAPVKLSRFFRKAITMGRDGFKNFYGRAMLVAGLKYKNWDRSRQCYQKLLEPFKEKVFVLKSKKEINNFLNKL